MSAIVGYAALTFVGALALGGTAYAATAALGRRLPLSVPTWGVYFLSWFLLSVAIGHQSLRAFVVAGGAFSFGHVLAFADRARRGEAVPREAP